MDISPILDPKEVAREMLALRGEAVRNTFGESVRQVFAVTEYGTPDPVGSGVLLKVEDRYFLVTAAHVLDHAAGSSLYLGGIPDLVLIEGSSHKTDPTGNPPNDSIDVAFVELASATVDQLREVPFLSPADLDPNDAT